MQQVGVWATHLKIHAVASLLQSSVYICTQKSKSLHYYWELYQPQNCIRPSHQENNLLQVQLVPHLEIAHVQRCHYEVVKMTDGSTPIHRPELENATQYMDLT